MPQSKLEINYLLNFCIFFTTSMLHLITIVLLLYILHSNRPLLLMLICLFIYRLWLCCTKTPQKMYRQTNDFTSNFIFLQESIVVFKKNYLRVLVSGPIPEKKIFWKNLFPLLQASGFHPLLPHVDRSGLSAYPPQVTPYENLFELQFF